MKVYLAGPLSAATRIGLWEERLRQEGIEITSAWHRSGETVDPHAPEVRAAILDTNLADLMRADVLLADTTEGEEPGCTFAEIGYALRGRMPVVWRQQHGRRADGVRSTCLMDAHVLVTRVYRDAEVVPALRHAFAPTW